MTTRPRSAAWRCITFLMLSMQASPSTALWQDQAWVRKYPCNQSYDGFVSLEQSPFWIDSFRGSWDTQSDSAELKLDILAVHNQSLLTCEEIDVSLFETSLNFQTLGYSVGQLRNFRSNCPLPITDTLTPTGHTLFSSYHLIYSFQSTHRFQTLESIFSFKQLNGNELDCGIAKITPDLGETASAALIFTPFSILVIVAFSSWITHRDRLSSSYVLDHDSVLAGQELLWATVLDIAEYLRHLQFTFVSASMTIEYPGFYVPAVGKLAWASLLYWRGPFDYGYSYQGPSGGMYPSNSSYGLGFMTQMLRYPNMLNTLANSMVNLAIIMSPIFFILSLWFWIASSSINSRPNTFLSFIKKAVGTTVGIALCFFSVPLLSYIAYDLLLVGYLPNYRIGLAILMLLIICGASHFLTRTLYDQFSIKLTSASIDEMENSLKTNLAWIRNMISRHLPHTMPLLQAVGIGGLQGFPIAQLLILILCECVYLFFHLTVKRDNQTLNMGKIIFSATRLLTALLKCVFVLSASQAKRQWIGYIILCIHGSVIVLGFFVVSVWNLIRTNWRSSDESLDSLNDANLGAQSLDLQMDDLPRLTYRVNRMNIARTTPKNHHGSITSRISHHSTDHRGHKRLFQHLRVLLEP
uniref:TRP C-terminal domain-containing protein n=1 Tax=Bionectria ochroleuca TaxID=29856 RepID=A0A8H7KF40_BIOOC